MKNFERIGIIYNPIAGRGKSQHFAVTLKKALEKGGTEVILRECVPHSKRDIDSENLGAEFFESIDLLVIAGGDGTLMDMLPKLTRSGTPTYMLPTGNESLFAREFSMSEKVVDLVNALERNLVTNHYVANIDGRPFFTMASFGFDSDVIERIASRRTGPINHLSYVFPMLCAAYSHRGPRLRVEVDGKAAIDSSQGYLIIANSRQYALGLGFVPEATSSVSDLYARFFPYKSAPSFIGWSLKAMFSPKSFVRKPLLLKGSEFKIHLEAPDGYPVQADGEFVGRSMESIIKVSPEQLRVLMPLAASKEYSGHLVKSPTEHQAPKAALGAVNKATL